MALADKIRTWINLSHALAWHGTAQTQGNPNVKAYLAPDEPGLVAAFLDSRIQSGIEGELKTSLGSNIGLQIDSIFTHKTPTVKISSGNSAPVEIGDLLLVRQHFDTKNRTTQGKALLLQAKKNTEPNSGSISTGNPRTQFELYENWPEFEGVTRLPLGPWDFQKSRKSGEFGEYLAVFDGEAHDLIAPTVLGTSKTAFDQSSFPSTPKCTWANGQAVLATGFLAVVQCPNDFAEKLAEFCYGRAGEPFVPGAVTTANDWSDFVNTMLQTAANPNYTFLSRRTNIQTPTGRGATINALVAIQPLLRLAFMRQVNQYVSEIDPGRIPNFIDEPHFFKLALRKSRFVQELHEMSGQLRNLLTANKNEVEPFGDGPPGHLNSPEMFAGDGGHVPLLSVASSGPGPAWD